MEKEELKGQRFGRLTLTGNIKKINKKVLWECLCDCGNSKYVISHDLKRGHTTSCGCYAIEMKRARKTHGHTTNGMHSREMRAYCNMKDRCYREKNKHYKNYGGRGIKVCERWANSFSMFLLDMGLCPGNLTLDRIDNDGNYDPNNCRWADEHEQSRNKRTTRWIEHDGLKMALVDWAIYLKTDVRHIHRMLKNKTIDQVVEYYKNKNNL